MKIIFNFTVMLLLIGCSTQKKEKAESSPDLFNKGVKINYRVSGNGDTTLLFVHGWCIDQTYWDNQVNYFSNNYKVVTLDLPGHGKSGRERTLWTIENYGSDVSMIMDALDLKNIVLVGHSMGGNIILEAANRNQQKVIGFIGVDNFKDLGAEYSEEQAAEFDGFIKTIRQDYKGTAGGFAEGMLFSETTDKSIKERVINDILNADPEIAVPILESLIKLNVKERGLMQQLPLKVHLINSDVIPTNKAQLEKYCTGSYEIYSIGLTGHYPMIEASDRFNRILEGILHNL